MEIGIHGRVKEADVDLVRELGVTWCKWGSSVEGDQPEDDRPLMEMLRDMGIRVVVDVRTSVAYMQQGAVLAQQRLQKMGNWEVIPARHPQIEQLEKVLADEDPRVVEKVMAVVGNMPPDWETRQAIMLRNADRSMSECNREVADKCAAYVDLHRDYCQDYEFWGEYRCPWVSQGIFDRQAAYPAVLQQVYKAIKSIMPEARVWNGGYGMNLEHAFIQGLLQEGAGESFDVCNWHPYFMTVRDRGVATDAMRGAFTWTRDALQRRGGTDQPFAATEWGYPTHSPAAETAGVTALLESNVCREGVSQLGSAEAVDWYEGDLQIMDEFGFEVVIVHALRDTPDPARHWGSFCGLVTVEGDKKPVWHVVQKWAEKGRAGRPAFGG